MKCSVLKARTGQAIVLLLTLLIAMAMLSFWILDIRTFIMQRLMTQDAGDAAALAAARWQAAGLNLCGELNLIQAYMLADDKENIYAAQNLHELRARIQLTTPILAAHAAQLVAEKNGLPEIPEGTEYVRNFRDTTLLEGFYEGAEDDLRDMLIILASEPIRAVPMTGVFEEAEFHNYLIDESFYDAILSQNWCFFYKNPFLSRFSHRRDFGPLPKMRMAPFFDLHLSSMQSSLEDLVIINTLSNQLVSIGHPELPSPRNDLEDSQAKKERYAESIYVENVGSLPIEWTTYDMKYWGPWTSMHPGELPIQGRLIEAYDYDGANIALSVQLENTSWTAAAKPFGKVGEDNPTLYDLTLGGFDSVRLVPVDATDIGTSGFNFTWLNHIRHHVVRYMDNGKKELESGCSYCSALKKWEDPAFRQSILSWLAEYGDDFCRPCCNGGSPGGDDGGTRYGH